MQSNETVRRQLADAILRQLKAELPGISAHMGEDYQNATDPEAVRYRESGAHFHWLAFAFSPWRMWDLHVGVVDADKGRLSIGFHISERAREPLLESVTALGATIGAKAEHRPAAVEYQANLPDVAADAGNAAQLERTIADLCRAMAPVAKRIAPPEAMRSA